MKALLYGGELRDAYQAEIRKAASISLIMPLVTPRGIGLLEGPIKKHLERGGRLQILLGLDMFTNPDAIALLLEISEQFPEQCVMKYFESPPSRILHAKVAIFESPSRHAVIVGSSNFTNGGFSENYEANLLTTRRQVFQSLVEYFDQLFSGGRARVVDLTWLKSYRKWWKSAREVLALQRRLRRRLQNHRKKLTRPCTLNTLAGKRLAFTGTILEWPRERRLYPEVRRLGGEIAKRANSMAFADVLFQGDIFDRESTQKIEAAKIRGIPILSQDDFFRLKNKAIRTRGRRKRS